MPGTNEGGHKTAKTIKEKYGEDYYRKIGAAGGKKSRRGGFYADRNLAREAGRKGGQISRRGKTRKPVPKFEDEDVTYDDWNEEWV